MTNKIANTGFNAGIKRGVYSGRHRLEVKPTLNAPKTGYGRTSKTKIDMESMENAKFDENNTDRRGAKSKLSFRGNAPVRWSPQEFKDFGFQEDGGAFKGGRGSVKKGNKKDYAQTLGANPLKSHDPHPITLNSKLKFKT